VTADGRDLARGLTAYDSGEAKLIIGCRSQEIEQKLGYEGGAELVHRDNLVLLDK
jgi:glutamate 5-kinase